MYSLLKTSTSSVYDPTHLASSPSHSFGFSLCSETQQFWGVIHLTHLLKELLLLLVPTAGVHNDEVLLFRAKLFDALLRYRGWVRLCVASVERDLGLCCVLFELVKGTFTGGQDMLEPENQTLKAGSSARKAGQWAYQHGRCQRTQELA